MIKRIWKVPWAMWLHRNKMVHSGKGTRKADTVVETEVRELHNMGAPENMERHLQNHWNTPLQRLLESDQNTKKAWIRMARFIQDKALALNDADGTTQMQNTMQAWLQQG